MLNNNGKHRELRKNEETEQKPVFGQPYQETRKQSKFNVFGENLKVIPAEIELPSDAYDIIDNFILRHIDPVGDRVSFEEIVNQVFNDWAQKVTTDYKEFGKLLLNLVRRAEGLSEVDIK